MRQQYFLSNNLFELQVHINSAAYYLPLIWEKLIHQLIINLLGY